LFAISVAAMAASDDYYEVLGCPKTASEDDIRKAYKKAALRWHPDKNPDNKEHAEQMFKQVSEAYQILSDPEKRALYDRGGKEALSGGMGGGDGGDPFGGMSDPFAIFEQFFGGRGFDSMFREMDGFGGTRMSTGFGGGFGRGGDPFADDFFGGGLGGGGFSSFSSSSMSTGGGGGVSTCKSTTTKVVNGQRITVTETTVRNADGTVTTTRDESSGDNGASGGMLGGGFGGFGSAFGGDFFGGGFGQGSLRN